MRLIGAILLFSAATASWGQTAETGTRIGAHKLGESFQHWLATNRLDIEEICGRHHSDKDVNYKAVCKQLSAIRGSGRGTFATYSDEQTHQAFTWRFSDGALAEVDTNAGLAIQQQIQFLTDTYGPPTKEETVKYQDGYGATWDCVRVSWVMPDGALIIGAESINDGGGILAPFRVLHITFYSAAAVHEQFSAQQQANPYK